MCGGHELRGGVRDPGHHHRSVEEYMRYIIIIIILSVGLSQYTCPSVYMFARLSVCVNAGHGARVDLFLSVCLSLSLSLSGLLTIRLSLPGCSSICWFFPLSVCLHNITVLVLPLTVISPVPQTWWASRRVWWPRASWWPA